MAHACEPPGSVSLADAPVLLLTKDAQPVTEISSLDASRRIGQAAEAPRLTAQHQRSASSIARGTRRTGRGGAPFPREKKKKKRERKKEIKTRTGKTRGDRRDRGIFFSKKKREKGELIAFTHVPFSWRHQRPAGACARAVAQFRSRSRRLRPFLIYCSRRL